MNSLARGVKTKKISAHLVRVKFTRATEEQASKIATGLSQVIKEKAEAAEKDLQGNSAFSIKPSAPVIVKKTANPVILTFSGLVCGLFIGVALAFWR